MKQLYQTDDPQDPKLVSDPVTEEFLYFDGEDYITVEPHQHYLEPQGGVMVCSECPFQRPKGRRGENGGG